MSQQVGLVAYQEAAEVFVTAADGQREFGPMEIFGEPRG